MHDHIYFAHPDGSNEDLSSSKIVVLPVPYDKTSTWIKGSDKGPRAILEASGALEVYDLETASEVFKEGIYTFPYLKIDDSPEKMVEIVKEKVKEQLGKGKFVVTLGGEHSVSIGAIRAHSEKIKDLSVLQLDAHADLREEYEGSECNHACVMSRVAENNDFVQVGIRSVASEEKDYIAEDRIFFARDIINNDRWLERAVNKLSNDVYVTIDLDVFDPSIMPSTGTPEPGGLDWYKVTGFLREVSRKRNIVGFDIVELCPNSGNKAPDFLAAKLVYKLLSYIYSK